MASDNISKIIEGLLLQNKEGDYWDFKREYGSSNTDMLHDIVCMANQTSHKGDRYLIYGIAEDNGSLTVHGLTIEKKQADVLDYLRNQKFAVCPPDINLIALTYEDKKLNVIIMKDKPLKPYYLLEDIKENNNAILRAGAIYTRVGDTNTPKNKTADIYQVEQMWRERFGINLPAFERCLHLMQETENWEQPPTQIGQLYYHKHFAEFQIKLGHAEEGNGTPYTALYKNDSVYRWAVSLYFHGTLLREFSFLNCDGARLHLVDPEQETLERSHLKLSESPNHSYFYYYLQDSIEFSLLRILNLNNSECWYSPHELQNKGILIFKTEKHLKQFTNYLIEHLDDNVQYTPHKILHAKYSNLQSIVDFHQKCYVLWKEWRWKMKLLFQ